MDADTREEIAFLREEIAKLWDFVHMDAHATELRKTIEESP